MEYIQLSKLFYKDRDNYETIYNTRYNSEAAIHIPIKISGNDAFIVYTNEIINNITSIYKLDKKLTNVINHLPPIALDQFSIKSLVDEIKLTNEIEGVHSTRKEIKALLSPTERANKYNGKRIYGLVQKYLMLMGEVDIPLHTCKDIRNIYDDLVLKEVLADDLDNEPDGLYFRSGPVSIQGPDLQIIHNGVNPEENIIEYIQEGLKLINDDKINKLISVSAFHYLIGYIHPFYDGNGRLSRFISSYYLSKEFHPLVGYSLSYTLKKQIKLYYKSFKIVNDSKNKGDITPFVTIFLELIKEVFERLISTLSNKLEQLNYYSKCIDKLNYTQNISDLMFVLVQNTLFGEDGLSVNELAKILEISIPALRLHIKQINPSLLSISKSGNKNLYNVALDNLCV